MMHVNVHSKHAEKWTSKWEELRFCSVFVCESDMRLIVPSSQLDKRWGDAIIISGCLWQYLHLLVPVF